MFWRKKFLFNAFLVGKGHDKAHRKKSFLMKLIGVFENGKVEECRNFSLSVRM